MASNKRLRDIYPYSNKWPADVIGIEIEMEGSGLTTLQERMEGLITTANMWHQKGDGSLRGESCEWILRQPLEPIKAYEWLDRLWEMQNILKGVLFQPSRRCGVHIHINCQDMTQKQVYNFIAMYLLWENVLLRWAGQYREGNFFCLRGMDARYLSARLAYHHKTDNWRELPDDLVRYAAMNVGALFRYGSLEFRALPTPDGRSNRPIKDWANMLLQIKKAAAEIKDPKNIITRFSQLGATEYLVRVFGTTTPLLKIGGLQVLGKDGMRNLQDVLLLQPTWLIQGVAKDGHWYANSGEMNQDMLNILDAGPVPEFPDEILEDMEEEF